MRELEQVDLFLGGDYFDGAQADLLKAFERVDGYGDPYSILHPDYEQIPVEERIKVTARDPRDTIYRGMNGTYETQRCFWSKDWNRGYRARIGIQAKSPRAFFEALRERLGVELISVLDFGCGQGKPLETILKQDSVDETSSMGVTLPYLGWRRSKTDRVVYANSAHLGAKDRFSVTFSVLGGLYYHPYNQSQQRWTGAHGTMHALNLTSAPGLIIGYAHDLWPNGFDFTKELERQEIARRCVPRIDGFSGIEVLRRPTIVEIHEFMEKNYRSK